MESMSEFNSYLEMDGMTRDVLAVVAQETVVDGGGVKVQLISERLDEFYGYEVMDTRVVNSLEGLHEDGLIDSNGQYITIASDGLHVLDSGREFLGMCFD